MIKEKILKNRIGSTWNTCSASEQGKVRCGYDIPGCPEDLKKSKFKCNVAERGGYSWYLIDKNSPACGFTCPPGSCYLKGHHESGLPTNCASSGTQKCIGYDLYECDNGSWVLKEHNSRTCGYSPRPSPPPPSPCTEGDTKCVNRDLYECHNGNWVLVESNSETCGYTPHPPPPSECTEGETKCIDYDLYQCQNGKWVVIEHESDQCKYIPIPTPEETRNIGLIVAAAAAGLLAIWIYVKSR